MKEGCTMKESKRTRILETAMMLFNEFGFHATPTSKIAKKAKVSVGTLFNYFSSKEVLIHAIYLEIKIHSRHRFLEQLKEKTTEHDNLQSMWGAIIHWGIENPEEFSFLESFSVSPFKNSFKDDSIMCNYQRFRESILQSLIPVELCKQYPEYFLMHIDNASHSATRFILNNNVPNVEEFINASFDLLWKGFSN